MSRSTTVAGTHRVPGDKSITHRALLLAALAPGASRIGGALTSLDAKATARVLRALGAGVSPLRAGSMVRVTGRRRFARPTVALDCGNSGTSARLLLGLLAAHRFRATLTGDASLSRRPMHRVTAPLVAMGARVDDGGHDGLPLIISGGALHALDWNLSVASAQVKSALLLAGMAAGVAVRMREIAGTRDHTERLLRHFGYSLARKGRVLRFTPTGALVPFDMDVPGDPSSAAFLVAAALLAARGEICVTGVGLNPSRIGFLSVMQRMGARIDVRVTAEAFGEPRGELVARPADLHAVTVRPEEVPGVIDEIPMLACLAARANGTSVFSGVGELRVKESNRLALIAENLRRIGVKATDDGDELRVTGTDAPLKGKVVTAGDHRIAMAFAVLGRDPRSTIRVDDPACAAVSFPGFAITLASLYGARQ